jgi:hypothetical protein
MKRRTLLIGLFLVVALAGAAFAYVTTRPTYTALSGNSVGKDRANRRPIAVMFDNYSPDARPQSGLSAASMVFETLAEGGITRFMGVYEDRDAAVVGPVRSTRIYFNAWAAGLGVIFGHDGGNVDALRQLSSLSNIENVDADENPGPFYRSTQRAVPHNEYTGTQRLRTFASSHGASTTGGPPAIPHKDDAPLKQRPAGQTIAIQFSYADYNVVWRYDRAANDYLRFMGGAPHLEATTGKQLAARNVVVMMARESSDPDPYTPGSISMQTVGSGPATVYRDGQAIQGTWSKSAIGAPLQWRDSSGSQIPLDRGATWVEVVPKGNTVSATG